MSVKTCHAKGKGFNVYYVKKGDSERKKNKGKNSGE
jgi:hypothetical protein